MPARGSAGCLHQHSTARAHRPHVPSSEYRRSGLGTSLCWTPSPLGPELRLSNPRASPGVRDANEEQALAPLSCSHALLLPELSKLPCSEAVCLQLDRSSASPACLLCFLIPGVGLSKSRAEPPWDQGEAGGEAPVPSSFFCVCGFFSSLFLLPLCSAHKAGL